MEQKIPSQDLIRARTLRNAKLKADPTCSNCGKTKTVADFPASGVDYWCTDCRAAYAIQLYHKRRSALSKSELQKLRAKINKRQNARRKRAIANMSPEALLSFRERINQKNMLRRNSVRDLVYKAYGGYRCACCGVTERLFLSIDHVNNDGAKHKREFMLRTGEQLYRWLARNKFPQGFQILCMNCQWGKRNNAGICPHQSGKV